MWSSAVILARGGVLDFDLPMSGQPTPLLRSRLPIDSSVGSKRQSTFLTEAEVERFERDNLVTALETANWKIKGPEGAAELLGIKPTTLLSRMNKWGVKRP